MCEDGMSAALNVWDITRFRGSIYGEQYLICGVAISDQVLPLLTANSRCARQSLFAQNCGFQYLISIVERNIYAAGREQ